MLCTRYIVGNLWPFFLQVLADMGTFSLVSTSQGPSTPCGIRGPFTNYNRLALVHKFLGWSQASMEDAVLILGLATVFLFAQGSRLGPMISNVFVSDMNGPPQ